MSTSWEKAADWYDRIVSDQGHEYHRTLILPKLKSTLGKPKSVLDLACGQGILTTILPKECDYLGLDIAEKLIEQARKRHAGKTFKVCDCTVPLTLKQSFEKAFCILATQNIADPHALFKNAFNLLKEGGTFTIVLNHPCFRIPRQSSWGMDPKKKMQFRRVDSYMSPQEIPITVNPSKNRSEQLISFHHPLSDYFMWLKETGFVIEDVQEWCSPKTSEGKGARAENRARKEFPLFLTIIAKKGTH